MRFVGCLLLPVQLRLYTEYTWAWHVLQGMAEFIRWRACMLYMHACHVQHLLQVSACCSLLKCTFSSNNSWGGEGTLCAALYDGPPMGHRAMQIGNAST